MKSNTQWTSLGLGNPTGFGLFLLAISGGCAASAGSEDAGEVGAQPAPNSGVATTDDVVVTAEYQASAVAGVTAVNGRVLSQQPLLAEAPTLESISNRPAWADQPPTTVAAPMPPHYTADFADSEADVTGTIQFDMSELSGLANELEQRGIPEPSGVSGQNEAAASDELVEKSWSNGVDSRIDLSSRSGAQYDRVGVVRAHGSCSGTLVGRRLVLSAAHCITDDDFNYIAGTFTADETRSATPYGTQKVVKAYWGGKYRGCTDWASCVPEDWAVLVLEDNFKNSAGNYAHPGWQGYGYYPNKSVYSTTFVHKRQHGYPTCGNTPGKPSGCTYPTLYGQTYDCTIGDFFYPFSNGYEAAFSHGCDFSPGMSGSAVQDVYYNRVLGISLVSRCWFTSGDITCQHETNAAIKKNPTLAKRLDSYIFSLIGNLRVQYP